MANGSIIPNMDMCGGLITGIAIFNLTDLKDIGHGQMMAGSGFQIMNGDGRLFTMVVGSMILMMAGSGFRIMNGHQPGWYGVAVMTIMVGHR